MSNSLLVVLCCLGLCQTSQAAEIIDRCQRNAQCRSHADKGLFLSDQKNYSLALAEFQAAYAIVPAARLLLNIGRILYRLDRPQEALEQFSRYRKEVPSMDLEVEQTLRRYEIEASTALVLANRTEVEPPPAPLQVVPDRFPPKAALALIGCGVGFFIIGIGLGVGAINTAKDLSQPSNNYSVFGLVEQNLQTRGLRFQTSGIAFDVLGTIAITTGAASIITWHSLRKSGRSVAQAKTTGPVLTARPTSTGPTAFSFGSM